MTTSTSIGINGHTVQPESLEEGGVHHSPDAAHSDYVLIQCRDAISAERVEEFKSRQATLLQTLGPDACICKYGPTDLSPVRSLSYVVSANVYHTDHVIEVRLLDKIERLKSQPSGAPEVDDSDPSKVSKLIHPREREISTETDEQLGNGIDHENLELDVLITLHRDPASPPPIALPEPTQQSQAHVKSAIDLIIKIARINPNKIISDGRDQIRTRLGIKYLVAVAQVDQVQRIEELHESKLWNHICRKDMKFITPWWISSDWLNASVRGGEGETIVVSDSGFDNWRPEIDWKKNPHAAFRRGPTKVTDFYGSVDSSDAEGHGTHVSGSIIGNGSSKTFGAIQGTAPLANLIVQSLWFLLKFKPPQDNAGLQLMYMAPYNESGAKIHSTSWGDPMAEADDGKGGLKYSQLGYTWKAKLMDSITWNKPDYLLVTSAGNEGLKKGDPRDTSQGQIGGEAIAKNALVVGAVDSTRRLVDNRLGRVRDHAGIYYSPNGTIMGNPLNVARYSSRGPTQPSDGAQGNDRLSRIKPDLVAPGTSVYSARSRDIDASEWNKEASNLNYHGDCPPEDGGVYIFATGTSMAAPLVAGCAAVVSKALKTKRTKGFPPPAALIKALLINNAVDLFKARRLAPDTQWKSSDLGPLLRPAPDPVQGYGLVNLEATLRNITDTKCGGMVINGQPLSATGGGKAASDPISFPIFNKKDLYIAGQNMPITFSVTLVWTDCPGAFLNSNLSLKVTDATGREFFDNNSPAPGLDRANNVRRVVIENAPAGTTKIQVTCLATSAEPGNGPIPYSLAWYASYGPPSRNAKTWAVAAAVATVGVAAAYTLSTPG